MKALTKQSLRDFVLTPEQQAAVLQKMSKRDATLLEFLLATGARVSEALSIRCNAIKTTDETATITISGKGNKVRQLRVRASMLLRIQNAYNGQLYLFESSHGRPLDRSYVWRRVHSAAKRVGLNFSPHCARHTFATQRIAHTGKIKAVSRYLGHSTPAITMAMYVHESLSEEELGIGS